ncbi:rhomboid family intramembrane serine protease [Gammaproteobacteria bacterium]|nr:rhomboid family intramembrane serine protease [Gammaproteobacteria bacterium]
MYKVLEVSIQEDLGQFSRLLWQRKISHRIYEVESRQILTVPDQSQVMAARHLFQQWQRGEVIPDAGDSSDFVSYFSPRDFLGKIFHAFRKATFTLSLIVLCIILAFLAPLNAMTDLTRAMLYPDFSFGTRIIDLDNVRANFSALQFLKMISPMLLHGGIIHLAFNMLWLWEFGRRIEAVQASWSLLVLIVFIALVSNTVQYLYGGSIYFGGMSGVVYGLFSYIWMWQLFDPKKNLSLPGPLIFFLLLSLVVITVINLDFIADEAHIGGLLTGVVYGAFTATISRLARIKHTNKKKQ